jgi:DNA-binding MarR family transcriptional regulator
MGKLVDLVTNWEAFLAERPEGSLAEFGHWLNREEEPRRFHSGDPAFGQYADSARISMQAGYLIGKLHGYLQLYAKPMMRKHGLHSMDDFGYLATVNWHGTIAKSQACANMLQELTTGGDIIRRLIERGLMKEVTDAEDRRRRLLQLTARGKNVVESIQREFADLPDVLGDLDAESRVQLVQWLAGLDHWHDRIVRNKK